MAFELSGEVSPGISISPMHGGWSVSDPDGVAAELASLIPAGHSLARHIDKTQTAGADRQVLVLLPDSTWGAAWDLGPDRLGSGPVPTLTLGIADPIPLEIWLVGDRGLVWIYTHPGGEWRQRQDPRQAEPR